MTVVATLGLLAGTMPDEAGIVGALAFGNLVGAYGLWRNRLWGPILILLTSLPITVLLFLMGGSLNYAPRYVFPLVFMSLALPFLAAAIAIAMGWARYRGQ